MLIKMIIIIIIQNKHPIDLKNPFKSNSNIYPRIFKTHPIALNNKNPMIIKTIIPISSILSNFI